LLSKWAFKPDISTFMTWFSYYGRMQINAFVTHQWCKVLSKNRTSESDSKMKKNEKNKHNIKKFKKGEFIFG